MSNPTFDLYKIQSATQRAKDYAQDTIQRVKRRLINKETKADRTQRLAYGLCRWCYFRQATALYGQAITAYICLRCDQEYHHGNTGVPLLCTACVKATGLCAKCCGDWEGQKRDTVP